jgi:hypothetical protein
MSATIRSRIGSATSVLAICAVGQSANATPQAGKASPDVQSQVGVGKEKADEAEERNPKQPKEHAPTAAEPEQREADLGHMFQFGGRAGITLPYRVMFRFDDSPSCQADQPEDNSKPVCGYGAPAQLDLAISFALLDSIEPFVWAAFGLGDDERSNTAALQLFGAGLRIYTLNKQGFKLFFQAAGATETEGMADSSLAPFTPNANFNTDILLHLNFGGQYDFSRHAGVYLSLGPNVSFVRAITTQLAATVGVQFRAP